MHSHRLSSLLARLGVAALFSFGAATHAGVVKVNGHTFTVADGYELELIAQTPLVGAALGGHGELGDTRELGRVVDGHHRSAAADATSRL